jgi:hypothetical protein
MLILCVLDAIFGLRELFDTYPQLILQLLAPLVTATVRLMSDEVRVSAVLFLESAYDNTGSRTRLFGRHCSPFTGGSSLWYLA